MPSLSTHFTPKPALAGGALTGAAAVALTAPRPQFAARFHLPTSRVPDPRLFIGAMLVGMTAARWLGLIGPGAGGASTCRLSQILHAKKSHE